MSSALEAFRAAVPSFLGNQTLAQLLAMPESSMKLPLARRFRHSLFRDMRREWTLDGVGFDLAGAPDAGRIELRYAVSPRPSMLELVDGLVAEVKRADGAVADVRAYQGTTLAGEYFGLAFVAGMSVERAVGALYANHHCVVIDGRYAIAGRREELRDFVFRLTLELPLRGSPAVRARPVFHAVPRGWAVRTRDLTTHLIAPDGSYMTVLPAEPVTEPATITKKILFEDVVTRVKITSLIATERHETPLGLRGQIFRVGAVSPHRRHPFRQATAVLVDERFRYVVRYVDETLKHERLFMELVDSIVSVPNPAGQNPAERLMTQLFPVD